MGGQSPAQDPGVMLPYRSHLHIATASAIIAAHAPTPSSTPTIIPRAFDCGPSSGLRSSIGVFSMRIRMVLVSWSNMLMVNCPSQERHPNVAAQNQFQATALLARKACIKPFARTGAKTVCCGYTVASVEVVCVKQDDIKPERMDDR